MVGKVGKNILKQILLRSALPTYKMLTNKGESLLKDYLQKQKRGKGIFS